MYALVERHVRYCCIGHLLQTGVKTMLKKIGHEPDEGLMVKAF